LPVQTATAGPPVVVGVVVTVRVAVTVRVFVIVRATVTVFVPPQPVAVAAMTKANTTTPLAAKNLERLLKPLTHDSSARNNLPGLFPVHESTLARELRRHSSTGGAAQAPVRASELGHAATVERLWRAESRATPHWGGV
jgi:hypothetical protein